MVRKSKKASNSHSATSFKTELGLSDLRLRLNFLTKENEKFLSQIEKNRAELDNLNNSIEEISIQITQRSAPFRQRILELDRQIHNVFKEIFAARKLGKKPRKDIQTIYYNLQSDGFITPNSSQFDADIPESDNSKSSSNWDNDQERSPQKSIEDISKLDREELKKIRQIFLRLAEVFHPDKVTDEAKREYCTEVMKEINQAYQNGDLAKLLAIEKQQDLNEIINRDSNDDLMRECAKVDAENAFLKNQLSNLKLQLKLTKNTPQGQITANFRRITKYGGDPIGTALVEMEAQIEIIEQLHKLAIAFRDRRITIKEFLQGPIAFMQQQQMTEEDKFWA